MVPMYDLMACNNNYAQIFARFWWYHKDDPNDNIADSESLRFKSRITLLLVIPRVLNTTAASNTKGVEIAVPFKYLSNFWRTLEIPLINYEINLLLICRTITRANYFQRTCGRPKLEETK